MLQMYPDLCALAQICRVIPIHSADVERTFSQLKLIKSNIRNRILEKTFALKDLKWKTFSLKILLPSVPVRKIDGSDIKFLIFMHYIIAK